MTTPAPAFNTSTRIETTPRGDRDALSLVESGGSSRRLSAHYMVIDTSAPRPILGEWPHTAKGLRAARAFYAARVAL
jgi:hypothetical protein